MNKLRRTLFNILATAVLLATSAHAQFRDAAQFGFLPENDGFKNAEALQKAVDGGGTITVSKKGVYAISKEVKIGDDTHLVFGADTVIKKTAAKDAFFPYVFVNKGAYTKTFNRNIRITGLNLSVGGIDQCNVPIVGLIGHLSFFYVKDLRIENFRCLDLENGQFCIQICTFENIIVRDAIINGKKDGVHLGRGKTFKIADCDFTTFDDAIALNAHDYSTSNPELGWIEDGVIENITDRNEEKTVGYFCRILGGAWTDWYEGMKIQRSDSVVSDGRIYRSVNKPDGKVYISKTRPTHKSGMKMLDGIIWRVVQEGATYTAGVRNVVFRDIFLYKPRTAFSVHFDTGIYSRSYYPDAPFISQSGLVFDNVRVMFDKQMPFLTSLTPIDSIVANNCHLKKNKFLFFCNSAMKDFGKTSLRLSNCTFDVPENFVLIENRIKNKQLDVQATGSILPNGKPAVKDRLDRNFFDCDFLDKK